MSIENEKWGILPSSVLKSIDVVDYHKMELPDDETNAIVSKWQDKIKSNLEKFNYGIVSALLRDLRFDCTFQEYDEEVYDTEIRPFLKGENAKKDLEWYQNYMSEIAKKEWKLEVKDFLDIFDIEKYLNSNIVRINGITIEDNNDDTQTLIFEVQSEYLIESEVLCVDENLSVDYMY